MSTTRDDGPDGNCSPVPVLGEGFGPTITSSDTVNNADQGYSENNDPNSKLNKLKFWSVGKKKGDKPSTPTESMSSQVQPPAGESAASFASQTPRGSSPHLQQAFAAPASPGRNIGSGSPRLHSPASSQIFERNVQEDSIPASSSAIPSHINTENHIPPVLDASSMAITDTHLSPDTVEIVTHVAHQPAALSVAGGAPAETPLSPSFEESVHQAPESEEPASTYGALDAADVRRLSFISFADVVHAEHVAEHGSLQNSSLLSGGSSIASPTAARSPSPIRSPISPPLSGSMSGSPSFKSTEASFGQYSGALPSSPRFPGHGESPPTVSGELAIETMRQALRKTGSRDLSGVQSQSSLVEPEGKYP